MASLCRDVSVANKRRASPNKTRAREVESASANVRGIMAQKIDEKAFNHLSTHHAAHNHRRRGLRERVGDKAEMVWSCSFFDHYTVRRSEEHTSELQSRVD